MSVNLYSNRSSAPRLNMSLLIRCLLILTVVSNYSAATAADHVFNLSTTAEKHEQGRKIYNYRCYFCHGYSGDAKTLASTYLTPKPRNFIHRNSRDLSRKYMIQIVTSGKKDTAMHGFSRLLTDLEIYAVVDFVRAEFIDNQRLNTCRVYRQPAFKSPLSHHRKWLAESSSLCRGFSFRNGFDPAG